MTCCTCHPTRRSERLNHDVAVCASALLEGDLPHALHHLAGAYGEAPLDARVVSLREQLASRLDLREAMSQEGSYYGNVALAASAHADAGAWSQAIELLGQVASIRPDVGYEHLLTAWLTEAGAGLTDGAAWAAGTAVIGVGATTIGLHRLMPGERALLLSWAEMARAFVACGPPSAFQVGVPGLYRRVGWLDEALVLADELGTDGDIQKALTLRTMGDGPGALALFQATGGHAIEVARCILVAGGDALAAFAPYVDDVEVGYVVERLRQQNHEDPRDLLDTACRQSRAGPLTAPNDATANLLRTHPLSGRFQTSVAGWESPSNRLAVALLGNASLEDVGYTMRFDDGARPVLAQIRGDRPLWRLVDGVVVPAVEAPNVVLTTWLLGAIAPYADIAYQRAAECPVAPAQAYIDAMVHPPAELDLSQQQVDRLFAYQVLAAMCAARRPWDEALPALTNAIFGPLDWASAAAILALAERARHDAVVAFEARRVLCDVTDDLADLPCEPRVFALANVFGGLPGVPKQPKDRIEAWGKAFLGGGDEEQTPQDDAAAPGARQASPDEVDPASDEREGVAPSMAGLAMVGVVLVLLLAAFVVLAS